MTALTPMLRQYFEIKKKYDDCILLYRMGDFYEMFFEDAVTASKILEIALTSRNKNKDESIPLCGVPYHSLSTYLNKLINAGYKVAICEQVEDPKTAKSIVKREVVRIVSPGLKIEDSLLTSSKSNYLLAAVNEGNIKAAALLDISTGDFKAAEEKEEESLFNSLPYDEISEIILPFSDKKSSFGEAVQKHFSSIPVNYISDHYFIHGENFLLSHFKAISLQAFSVDAMKAGLKAAAAVLKYAKDTQKSGLSHVISIKPAACSTVLQMDDITVKNLEIFSTYSGEKKGSLIHHVDRTSTPMGARKLRELLRFPLAGANEIKARLDAVEELISESLNLKKVSVILKDIYDLERIAGKIALNQVAPRDLIALKNSILKSSELKEKTNVYKNKLLRETVDSIDPLDDVRELIENTLTDSPPFSPSEGGVIRKGFNQEVDDLRLLSSDTKSYIFALESKEKSSTGISSLKVRFNKVFGYYIEVSNTNRALVPPHYVRKQTLVNCERYITEELKDLEEKVITAQSRLIALENELFSSLKEEIKKSVEKIISTSRAVAFFDFFLSLAILAEEEGYIKPEINDSLKIEISNGRHPVLEKILPKGEFIPNDISIDSEANQIMIITGPNMAGKSTIMRQTALIIILAQLGSFVPSESARIGTADKIFTRIGASDALIKGLSTFMVEMIETGRILNGATERSIIILDEIGRGTSTFDGISIAWAVAEFIHDRIKARTLFATHYHELAELALTKERIKNYNVEVKEWGEKIIFLRKLSEGSASRSYGIQVARLSGIPDTVISRSLEVLKNLENKEFDDEGASNLSKTAKRDEETRISQLSLFSSAKEKVVKEIQELQVEQTTPIDALKKLADWKQKLIKG